MKEDKCVLLGQKKGAVVQVVPPEDTLLFRNFGRSYCIMDTARQESFVGGGEEGGSARPPPAMTTSKALLFVSLVASYRQRKVHSCDS